MYDNLAYADQPWEERIGGKPVAMSPPASMNHRFVADNIYWLLRDFLRGKPCVPIADGAALYLTDEDYYIPDVMVVCDREKIREDGVHGAPDLVVEVLSPGTCRYDRGRKRDVYEASGVREYWLVDPASKSVEQYLLQSGRFVLADVYSVYPDWMLAHMKPEERDAVPTEFRCSLFDGLVVRLDDVFYRVF